MNQFDNIIKHGTYYYPAERHYYAGCVVRCDRCNRTNLRASIGYQEMDLCLACASQIESLILRVNPPSVRFPDVSPPAGIRFPDVGIRSLDPQTQHYSGPCIRLNSAVSQQVRAASPQVWAASPQVRATSPQVRAASPQVRVASSVSFPHNVVQRENVFGTFQNTRIDSDGFVSDDDDDIGVGEL
jgi:hypothetical protein